MNDIRKPFKPFLSEGRRLPLKDIEKEEADTSIFLLLTTTFRILCLYIVNYYTLIVSLMMKLRDLEGERRALEVCCSLYGCVFLCFLLLAMDLNLEIANGGDANVERIPSNLPESVGLWFLL